MSKANTNLSQLFGIINQQQQSKQQVVVVDVDRRSHDDQSKQFDDDFDLARDNVQKISENGGRVLNALFELAQASESPRAYEVLAKMIDSLTKANKDLLDIHQQRKTIKQEQQSPNNNGNITIDKAVFVGSTADLNRQLKKNNGSNENTE
jgi:hypothetical protein